MATRRAVKKTAGGPNRTALARLLEKEDPAKLRELLLASFNRMTMAQRRDIFDPYFKAHEPEKLDSKKLLKEIQRFDKASRKGEYYAPFDVDSKNYMKVPEETTEWCSQMADYIEAAVKVCRAGEHEMAVQCFGLLFLLIEDMGEEIVFADELGSWMVPTNWHDPWMPHYIESISAISSEDEFADRVIPILLRDARQSNTGKAYISAMAVKNEAQVAKLRAEIERRKIRVRP